MRILITAAFILIVIAAIASVVFLIGRMSRRRRLRQELQLRLLLVRLTQVEKDKADLKQEINLSGQLFTILAGLKAPFSLEVAVADIGEEINFYIAVPDNNVDFAIRQIHGLWPEAQIESVEDYTIFSGGAAVDAAYLKFKNNFALPIRTFAEANTDTFSPILSNLTKLQTMGEGAALQIITKPAPASSKETISKIIAKLKKGLTLEKALEGKMPEKKSKEEAAPSPVVIDEEAVKILSGKIAKPLFSVNVRLITASATPPRAEALLNGLAGSFNQFAAPSHNEFRIIRGRPKDLIYQFVFREYTPAQAMILGADELTSIFHLPTSATTLPKIKWVKAKEAEPPAILPEQGVMIGNSSFRGELKPVRITDDDRRRHVYMVGQTGTGKSSLLVNMATDDIKNGKGAAVIDPHGDLIDSILGLIPENRRQDVIIFDPGDTALQLLLNKLEHDASRPEEKTFIVNEMQSIFNKLFTAETMGPIFEQYMRNALLLLMEDFHNPATLMEVPRVFTDAVWRKEKITRITNPAVIDFWEKEAIKAGGEASLANITPYVTSKFNNFIANDYVRPIIGQVRSSFNFRKVMDEGKILLVNLSKGRIGDINAGLLGMVIVGKLLMAALSRVDMPQENRRDFNLYIDEFQNFTTDSIATILSEARKYRLSLVIAHQFTAQLEEKISDAVFGNVGSMIVFRVGAEDAEFLVKQFEPVFSKNDLINIDNFNAYAKLLIGGQTSKPFNIRTLPPQKGNEQIKMALKESSRQTYGRGREEVEAEILKRLRS